MTDTLRKRFEEASGEAHCLKVWPDYFESIIDGSKTFELRKDDRGFQIGDILVLREYAPGPDEYTGREVEVFVTYRIGSDTIPFGPAALKPGYCVLGFLFVNDLLKTTKQQDQRNG